MRLLSSLRSRIFLTSVLLTILSLGVATYIVSVNVTNEAESALQREISATGRVVEQLRARSTDTYRTMGRLIADEPKLKAAQVEARAMHGDTSRLADDITIIILRAD